VKEKLLKSYINASFLVDVVSSKRLTRLLKKEAFMYDFSNFPFHRGQWLVYYDKRKGHYYSFDMETVYSAYIAGYSRGGRNEYAVILYMMQWRGSGLAGEG